MPELTYREYKPADFGNIVKLWESQSGWGTITQQQFDDWHLNTPLGPCMIIVSQSSENEIIGQVVFRPTSIILDGISVRGYRIMAPIISKNVRGFDLRNGEHPAYALIKYGIELAFSQKIKTLIAIPALGWIAFLKTFSTMGIATLNFSVFNCSAISLSSLEKSDEESKDYCVKEGRISESYELLWREFLKNEKIKHAIDRNCEWLNWRRKDHLIYEMYKPGSSELGGVMILKKDGLLVELIAASTADMKLTIKTIANWLSVNQPASGISELKFMDTRYMSEILLGIPVYPVDYRFVFASMFPIGDMQDPVEEWFIMPDD